MTDRPVAAPFRPADDGEEPDTLFVQPRPLLAGCEVEVRLGPPFRPVILRPVEAGGSEPVLCRESERVVHAETALFGGVDEEQPTEGPVRLPAEVGLRLLFDEEYPFAGVDEFSGGDQTGQTGADDDRVGLVRRWARDWWDGCCGIW
ncbi:hypothetical protein ABMA10_13235 [Plantibacter sp. RU18]